MRQAFCKTVSQVGAATSTNGVGIMDGGGAVTIVPYRDVCASAGTFRNLIVYANSTVRRTLVATLWRMPSGSFTAAPTTLAVTLGLGVTKNQNTSDSVVVAVGDVVYLIVETDIGGASYDLALGLEFDGDSQMYAIPDKKPNAITLQGQIAGALGNGKPENYSGQGNASSYSIAALEGDITSLVLRTTNGVAEAMSSCTGVIVLNSVVQDGSPGTVDTRCILTAGNSQAVAAFTLPIVLEDRVNIVYERDDAIFTRAVTCGITFDPTDAASFMFSGGSNDVILAPLGYMWNRSRQLGASEIQVQAPVPVSGLVLSGLYIEEGSPVTGDPITATVRINGLDTALTVTFEGSGFVNADVPAVSGALLSISIVSTDNQQFHWGIAASIEEEPDTGTLIVRKLLSGSTDPTTEFPIVVGGGLTPADLTLAKDETHTYVDVPVGVGYSVSEPSPPSGWGLVSIATDNGSPASAISVGDGETVTVTVTNTPVVEPTTYAIRRLRRAPHLSTEQLTQFFSQFQLDIQAGVGLTTGQGSDPMLMLRMSKDGGFTWGNEHWVSAGRIGQYSRRAIWRRLGRGRDVVFEVTMTDPVFWALLDAYLIAERGTS